MGFNHISNLTLFLAGGQNYVKAPPPPRSRELLEGFRRKKGIRRVVTQPFRICRQILIWAKKWVKGSKNSEISGIFEWSLCPCFSNDFDGKGVLGFSSNTGL